jgi:hypothetical protein
LNLTRRGGRNPPDTFDYKVIRRIAILLPSLLIPAVVLAGCGASTSLKSVATTIASTTTVPAPSTTFVTGTTTVPGSTTTATTKPATTATTKAAPTGTIQLTDTDNGRSIVVGRGATVVVVLASTYWGFPTAAAPNAAVLQQVGGVTIVPSPPGTCVPGGGCGTASATYQAVGTGQATITASRTTCGEAMACPGTAGMYSVTVTVSGG